MKIFIIAFCAIIATNARVIHSNLWSQIGGPRVVNEPSSLLIGPSGRVIVDPIISSLERDPLLVSSRIGLGSPVGIVDSHQGARALLGERWNPRSARIAPVMEERNVLSALPIDRLITGRNLLSSPIVSERLGNIIPVLSADIERNIHTPVTAQIGQTERALIEAAELNGRVLAQVERDILSSPLVNNVPEIRLGGAYPVWNLRRHLIERVGLNSRGLQCFSQVVREILSSLVGCEHSLNRMPLSVSEIEWDILSQIAGEVQPHNVRALLENVLFVIERVLQELSPVEREILTSLESRRLIHNMPVRTAAIEREIDVQIAGQISLLARRVLATELLIQKVLQQIPPVERRIVCSSLGAGRSNILSSQIVAGRSSVNVPIVDIEREMASPILGQTNPLVRRALIESGLINGRALSSLSPIERNILEEQLEALTAERSLHNIRVVNVGQEMVPSVLGHINPLVRRALLESGLINGRALSSLSPIERNILEEQLETITAEGSLPSSQVERDVLSMAMRHQGPVQRRVSAQVGVPSGTWEELPLVRTGAWNHPVWSRPIVERPVWSRSVLGHPVWAQRELVGRHL